MEPSFSLCVSLIVIAMGTKLASCEAAVVDNDSSDSERPVSRFTAFPGACDYCLWKEHRY